MKTISAKQYCNILHKFYIALIILFCMSSTFVHAQNLPRIAVYATGGKTANENKMLANQITHALIGSNRFMTIERAEAFIEQVEREQATQRSGAIDDSQIVALGQQAGAQFVCIVEMVEAFGGYQIAARIVDVRTVVATHSGIALGELKTLNDFRTLSQEVVATLLGTTGGSQQAQQRQQTQQQQQTTTTAPAPAPTRTQTSQDCERLTGDARSACLRARLSELEAQKQRVQTNTNTSITASDVIVRYERVLERCDRENNRGDRCSDSMFQLGSLYYDVQDYAKSSEMYSRLIREYPNFTNREHVLSRLNQLKQMGY